MKATSITHIEISPVHRRLRNDDLKDVTLHNIVVPDARAQLAGELARHLALVAGQADGEDSAGRQKIRLLSPDEVATRALEIAEALWAGFEKREWMISMPSPDEVNPPKQPSISE